MRICVITVAGHGLGGMQDHTRLLARGLAASGHDVDVVTARHPDGLTGEAREGARWHFVAADAHRKRLPRRDPLWHRRSYERFRRLHAEAPFDVVHSESTSALELVRRGVHREVPVVLKLHGNYLGEVRQAWRRLRAGDLRTKARAAKRIAWKTGMHTQRGEWYRFRPCEWMVTSRHEFRDAYRESFLRPSQGHVVPNGIDETLFRPLDRGAVRAELGLDARPLLVCAGRLERGKGTRHAICALARLGAARVDAQLAVLGDGDELGELRALARDAGVADRTLFLGARPHAELARWLAAADVFLFPTQLNEAAPLVPLQAMACGAPVVASALGTVREVVDGAAILVPPGDAETLADAVVRLLADRDLRSRLGAEGRRRVVAEYTLDRMIERTLEVYAAALARHRAAT